MHTYYCVICEAMKVKVLCRNPDDYLRETKKDIHKGQLFRIFLLCIIIHKMWFCICESSICCFNYDYSALIGV